MVQPPGFQIDPAEIHAKRRALRKHKSELVVLSILSQEEVALELVDVGQEVEAELLVVIAKDKELVVLTCDGVLGAVPVNRRLELGDVVEELPDAEVTLGDDNTLHLGIVLELQFVKVKFEFGASFIAASRSIHVFSSTNSERITTNRSVVEKMLEGGFMGSIWT